MREASQHLPRPVFWGHVRQPPLVGLLPLAPLRLTNVRERLPVVERARLRSKAAIDQAIMTCTQIEMLPTVATT